MSFQQVTIDELLKLLDKYNHKELHVHHTWKPTHKGFTGNNHQSLQQAMKNHHMNVNGWSDIGQHVSLFPDGTFLLGRNFSVAPASIKGFNTGAFAVEMIGNFDKPNTGEYNNQGYDKLEGKQLDSILKLAKYFDEKKRYVRFHRENAGKTCPGTSIDKDVFMKMVREVGKPKDDIQGHWAENDIRLLLSEGLMSGRGDGLFYPNDPMTRAEVASVIARLIKRK